ncbi:hypothetical protein [Mesorhizobium sp.]|uniref:hypothetical protein n=1 Tax=Mesorhizobium sp. TaxID=1871066 RepID=UPI000FE657C7|nr:hypothetical protein [Mesorhizobium sp.]RWQ16129.1 MAG: hypothetical protein EOR93_23915 [Mesorhizobium sp.]
MTFLESFTTVDWFVIVTGCVLVILIPSFLLAAIFSLPEWIARWAGHTSLGGDDPFAEKAADAVAVPATADAPEISVEWSDIEREMRDESK